MQVYTISVKGKGDKVAMVNEMKEYYSDKMEMLAAERESRKFREDEQIRLFGENEITEIFLDLNKKNKKCYEALGNKGFKASEFVRYAEGGMIFIKNEAEYFIKNCWIKNFDDVKRFIEINK